ncbi:MAG: tyrosine-type recombinase/integrase [Thermodesulfovibrionales bacterium]|jgi:site-specific recombinase XerD|nr:tyrosine-type recombinase/integrase [Thermodesulfovibrionales bacterium]
MIQARPIVSRPQGSEIEAVHYLTVADSPIDRILQQISKMELPEREHFESYMRHKWRMNHKPSTLLNSFHAVSSFLTFYSGLGKSQLQDIVSGDLELFIEHEQDRGLKVTTVRTRLNNLWAFLRFLIEQDIINERILKRKIKLKVPDFLPRAIAPGDVRKFLGAIKERRARALILVLLRTGMRIGEVLRLKVIDLDIRERKIHIYEGEKNCLGRVVYLSDDALMALKLWLGKKEPQTEYLFPGLQRKHLGYTQARNIFVKYICAAGLQHKGYTMHSLRHTFASELLNAGMRLEYLQLLLGHRNIEMTRRYARLTDKSREEEYFRAMAIIEQGGIHGTY